LLIRIKAVCTLKVADAIPNVGGVMLTKQQLMKGVQTFEGIFWSLLSVAVGGDN